MLSPDDLQALLKRIESGATTAEDAERLKAHLGDLVAQANEATFALHGHTVFVGPCVHGRDPWDRCSECGEETAIHALLKVRAMLEADILARTMVIRDMVDEGWWEHTDDDCPEDDTCECALLKRVNDASRLEGHPGAALLERVRKLENLARKGLHARHHLKGCAYSAGSRPENPAECEDPECREWAKALEEK